MGGDHRAARWSEDRYSELKIALSAVLDTPFLQNCCPLTRKEMLRNSQSMDWTLCGS